MKNRNHEKDMISEQEYTLQMSEHSTEPGEDSPGDSESDAGAEFLVGASFEGDELSEEEEKFPLDHPVRVISEDALVVSSEQPSPWLDLDSASDTH